MTYKGFCCRFRLDKKTDEFSGEILCLKEAGTFHAKTEDELKRILEKAIEEYLFLCKKCGRAAALEKISRRTKGVNFSEVYII